MMKSIRAFGARMVAGIAGAVGLVGAAQAEVPAAVGTTLTSVQTDALAVIDLVWPVVLTVIGAFLLLKVTKRALSKV